AAERRLACSVDALDACSQFATVTANPFAEQFVGAVIERFGSGHSTENATATVCFAAIIGSTPIGRGSTDSKESIRRRLSVQAQRRHAAVGRAAAAHHVEQLP